MEVVPFFERRLFSPSMQNTVHSGDSNRKEFDSGALQLPSWQIDHNRYYCNQNASTYCSHRYPSTPASTASELQSHSSVSWHPYAYDTSDAFMTSRTNDIVTSYHGLDPRLASSRSGYSITSNPQTSSISHAHPTLINSFHRPMKGMEDAYQAQHPTFHRMNGAYSEAIVESKREWELSFMRGMPHRKLLPILSTFFCLFMVQRPSASSLKITVFFIMGKECSCFSDMINESR